MHKLFECFLNAAAIFIGYVLFYDTKLLLRQGKNQA